MLQACCPYLTVAVMLVAATRPLSLFVRDRRMTTGRGKIRPATPLYDQVRATERILRAACFDEVALRPKLGRLPNQTAPMVSAKRRRVVQALPDKVLDLRVAIEDARRKAR